MLKIEKKVKEIEIFGQVYKLEVPTFGMTRDYEAKTKSDPDNQSEYLIDILGKTGLPREICLELTTNDLIVLVNHLVDAEKK